MGNLTFSEIIWILVIILIVFGPNRLPELARKLGQFMTAARQAATALQQQIKEDYGDAIEPLKDVRAELRETRKTLSDTARAAARDIEEGVAIPEFPPPAPPRSEAPPPASDSETTADEPVNPEPKGES
ncbi:MAG: twin-arginine translocase TatA/TatE family subunit [Acidimicrobiia bacterium]|nr:twin-arginine translocase TatA/TatE family subunit [Acidimicrobiia bacterium]